MEGSNGNLVDHLVQALPSDVLDTLQQLSKEDFTKVLHSAEEKKNSEDFTCALCGKRYSKKRNLLRHKAEHTNQYKCTPCNYVTTRKDNWIRHTKSKRHLKSHETCTSENNKSTETPSKKRKKSVGAYNFTMNGEPLAGPSSDAARNDGEEAIKNNKGGATRSRRALNDNVEVVELQPSTQDERYDLIHFMREKREKIMSLLEDRRKEGNIKFYLNVQVRMIKYAVDGTYEEQVPFFRSNVKTAMVSGNEEEDTLEHTLNESLQKIFTSMEDFLKNGSGYQMEEVLQLQVTIIKYKPLCAGSYIHLPKALNMANCLLNVMNQDDRCFMWSVLASLHPPSDGAMQPEQVHHYQAYTDRIDVTGIQFPTPISQIAKFERQNATISINVFGYEERNDEIYPLFITKKTNCHHINLLYMRKDDNLSHYVLITNFDRFLSRVKKHNGETFFCYLCLQGFTQNRLLMKHQEECKQVDFQKISLPKEGEALEFKEYKKTERHPFVIYADFECLTRKVDTCEQNPEVSSTNRYQQMEAYSFGYQRVSIDERYEKPPVIYRGPDVIETFIDTLLEEEREIMGILSHNEPMIVNEFCLLEKSVYRTRMNTIRSDNHKIFAQTMIKKSLVPFDDKRWIQTMDPGRWN
ncbi:unnamed protein product [Mytilus coruscus]|uniref:C2H2-type domain-containing protein n=1 Tax=Mytilus coruscus TaxID=42192 RepID=A0A6J8EQM4_MYTCO|nr:unnamed protein product [Mytilus coruscus]